MGTEVNAFGSSQQPCTALHCATVNDLAEFSTAIMADARFTEVNAVDYFKRTALYCAAERSRTEISVAILNDAHFTQVNAVDYCQRTALHCAAGTGRAEVCRALLKDKRFQEVNAVSTSGRTALFCAAERSHSEACMVLLEDDRCTDVSTVAVGLDATWPNVLHLAIGKGLIQVSIALLQKPNLLDLDLNAVDRIAHRTALHWAALSGFAEVCRVLLQSDRFTT